MPEPKIFSFQEGFPSAAEQHIDLNDHLVKNKAATFLMRVNSNAMQEAGIHFGDVVIVDRMLEPRNGSVVIASIKGELLIRRYECTDSGVSLVPASMQLSAISVNSFAGFSIWGVVTYIIRSL